MENIKIRIEDYESCGLGDLYLELISFIGKYANENFDPFDLEHSIDGNTMHTSAIIIMKQSLKQLLDYLKQSDKVFIPSLDRNVDLKKLNVEEHLALQYRCKEYIIENLNNFLKQYSTGKSL